MNRVFFLRVFFVVICFSLLWGVAVGEEKDEKTSRQKVIEKLERHYDERVEKFKKENAGLKNIILLGDSLTEGFDVDKLFPDRRVLNRGIVADHVGMKEHGVLKRMDCSVFDCNPSHVFLLIGVNDLGDDNSPEAIERISKCYREICTTIISRAPQVKLYLQSCLPTGRKYIRLNESIVELNKRIKKIADDLDLAYIDLHTLMKDEKGELKDELTREGLHLKPKAYDMWRKALEPYLPPVMGTKRTGMTSSR